MNKIILLSGLLAAGMTSAFAADGTISFDGLVTDKTCDIVNNQGKNFTVTLPTVSRQTLDVAGAVAGRTPFQINLSNCSKGKVATYFEPGITVDASSGRLINQTTDGAQNVQIQLLGDNHQPVLVKAAGTTGAQENSQWVDTAAGGSADLDYYAEYYATDAATAGKVTSSVQYTIIYQ